jgi:glycosyltransferase involved in cell wall biosynthesis
MQHRVLIFRNELLWASETFILAQAGALKSFVPVYAGLLPVELSLQLPSKPVLLSSSSARLGHIRRKVYWQYPIAPLFHARLRSAQVQLIHAHFAFGGATALPVAKLLNVPLVVTLHGYDVTLGDDAMERRAEGRIFQRRREELWERASIFFCISKFIRDQALARGYPEAKLRLHYTGTDLSLFQPSRSERDPNLILFVGRLVEKKGCSYLLDAIAILKRKNPAVRLVMIGDGYLGQSLRERVNAERLPCEFLGNQPAHIVRDWMCRAQVFCAPSVHASNGDSEGLGMVFIEAQAVGTPVVSFDHGGIGEVVLDKVTGLLAPERDSTMLAAYLERFLSDRSLWAEFSRRGIENAKNRFDIVTQTARLEVLYSAAIAEFKPA